MTTEMTIKNECHICKKEKVVYKCSGCLQDFCLNDLSEHNREFEKQLDEIEDERNLFQQNLIELKTKPEKLSLIEQINQWEKNAIYKIQQTAQQGREIVFRYTNEIEIKLGELTKQLKQIRDEKDFNEIILNQLRDKFQHLEEELQRPSTMIIHEESNSFINRLIVIQKKLLITSKSKWKQNGHILIDNELSRPTGIFIDNNQTIYIADADNHRIIQFNGKEQIIIEEKKKQLIFPTKIIIDQQTNSMIICDHGNRRVLRRSNQNNQEIIISNIDCFDLIMDKQGYLYVSDIRKHEVQRWKIGDKSPTVVAGGNGQGNRLNQLSRPFYIFVDDEQSIYISDCDNHRIIKWIKNAKEGIVIAGGHGSGIGLHQLSFPNGIFVDQFETLYIADRNNHRIVRWLKNSKEGNVIIGGNGEGKQTNQLNRPSDLAFDRDNNLYILDWMNDRLLKFDIY